MTDYTADPEVIQEFLHARDRTTNWVSIHSRGLSFASPSSPPSVLSDEDAPGYVPSESDASSSHSLPPRMLLRYEDGRPDVPISHDHSPTHSRSGRTQSSSRHSRSRPPVPPGPADVPPNRYAQSLSYASGSQYAPSGQRLVTPPRSPENIRVLPSRQAEDSQRVTASTSHRPSVQTIFPRQPSNHDRVPPLADPFHTSNRSVHAPTPRHAPSSAQPIPIAASPAIQTHSQPAPGPHNGGSRFYEQPGIAASRAQSGLPYHYTPPAIIYAPSGKHGRSNYQPPAIVYSPASHRHRGAPGMEFSRSDPTPYPTQYSPQAHAGSTPFPSAQGSPSHRPRPRAQSAVGPDLSRARGRAPSSTRDRTRTRSPTPSLSPSDTSSDTSGSTYYVLPSPGQKVQIIVPNAASVYTSTPKSSRSPRSPSSPSSSGSLKKPFFQRIFSRGSGSVDSRGSSSQARGERGRIPVPWMR